MNKTDIEQALGKLNGRGSDEEFSAVDFLTQLGAEFPKLLLCRYRSARNWGERASCVYHAMQYARSSESAYKLGVEALGDRSKHVRHRACMLLALAQRADAIHPLQLLIDNTDSSADAIAAIYALEHQNQHYFVDREHSGMVTLDIEFQDLT